MFTEIYLGNQHGSISKTISTLQNILKGTREIIHGLLEKRMVFTLRLNEKYLAYCGNLSQADTQLI